MKPSADKVNDLGRDVAAARAELRGRCDQVVAEYEERLAALDAVLSQVDAGTMELRAAQARVRQLLAERGGAFAPTRAGRTTIGMSVPQARPSPGVGPQRMAPTPTLAEAAVNRAIQVVDLRIVGLLARARAQNERLEARLELSLLLRLRKSLERHASERPPQDPVLLAPIMESSEEVGAILGDLEAGGPARLTRLVDHARELVAELAALGGNVAGLKEQMRRARTLLAAGASSHQQALGEALAAFVKLRSELERRFPLSQPAWLDDLLK